MSTGRHGRRPQNGKKRRSHLHDHLHHGDKAGQNDILEHGAASIGNKGPVVKLDHIGPIVVVGQVHALDVAKVGKGTAGEPQTERSETAVGGRFPKDTGMCRLVHQIGSDNSAVGQQEDA